MNPGLLLSIHTHCVCPLKSYTNPLCGDAPTVYGVGHASVADACARLIVWAAYTLTSKKKKKNCVLRLIYRAAYMPKITVGGLSLWSRGSLFTQRLPTEVEKDV